MKKINTDNIFHIEKKAPDTLLGKLFVNAGIGKEPETKQSWKEVDQLYYTIAESIITVGNNINEAIRTINDIGVNDNPELIVSINGVRKDIEIFTSDLIKIRKLHEHKTGIINDGDELALCLGIFNDYVMLNDRFKAIIFPVVLTVTEHLSAAIDDYKDKQKLLEQPIVIEGEVSKVIEDNINE